MARLTSKYQLTVPKAVAHAAGFEPGDQLQCEPVSDGIRVRPIERKPSAARSVTHQLILFDMATERQQQRERLSATAAATERDWTRDELYES